MSNAFLIVIGLVALIVVIWVSQIDNAIDRENVERLHQRNLMRELRRYDDNEP